jgi:hypothetical protein
MPVDSISDIDQRVPAYVGAYYYCELQTRRATLLAKISFSAPSEPSSRGGINAPVRLKLASIRPFCSLCGPVLQPSCPNRGQLRQSGRRALCLLGLMPRRGKALVIDEIQTAGFCILGQ